MADFVVKFSEPSAFSFKFGANSAFSFKFGDIGANFNLKFGSAPSVETYKGFYNVIPQIDKQILETANKYMKKNMEIMGIPIYTVENLAGGDTVHIAAPIQPAILGKIKLGEVVL